MMFPRVGRELRHRCLRGSGSHRRAEVGDDDARRPERRSSEVRADVETRANARTSLLPAPRPSRATAVVRRVASFLLFPLALTVPRPPAPAPVHPGSWSVSSGAMRSWTSPTSRTSSISLPHVRPSPRISSRARIAARRAETAVRTRPAPHPPRREADVRGGTHRHPQRALPRRRARLAAPPSPS